MADSPTAAWLGSLLEAAADTVAVWRAMDGDFAGLIAARRELHARVAEGSVQRILAEQEAVADALAAALQAMSEEMLLAPGGEEHWNVAQAFAHTTAARRFLPTWAALDCIGEWPEERPPIVTPSIPGPPDAGVDQLVVLLDKSRAAQRRAAERIAGHERQRCRLDHPLVGHLRCGEWLCFAGVHDLMHLEQLHRLAAGSGGRAPSAGVDAGTR